MLIMLPKIPWKKCVLHSRPSAVIADQTSGKGVCRLWRSELMPVVTL